MYLSNICEYVMCTRLGREWARAMHGLWANLAKRVVDDVGVHPDRHSLLPRKHPVVVPGGRFRESYYWDTFWTVRCHFFIVMLFICRTFLYAPSAVPVFFFVCVCPVVCGLFCFFAVVLLLFFFAFFFLLVF